MLFDITDFVPRSYIYHVGSLQPGAHPLTSGCSYDLLDLEPVPGWKKMLILFSDSDGWYTIIKNYRHFLFPTETIKSFCWFLLVSTRHSRYFVSSWCVNISVKDSNDLIRVLELTVDAFHGSLVRSKGFYRNLIVSKDQQSAHSKQVLILIVFLSKVHSCIA